VPDIAQPLVVGMDLGTSSSSAVFEGGPVYLPSVVGTPRPGLLPGLLPDSRNALFGEDALVYHNLVDMVWPIRQGTIADARAATAFCAHMAKLIDPSGKRPIHVVVGTPAHAPPRHMAAVRQVLAGSFQKVQFYSEPFLVVMGLRADKGRAGQVDPALNSMVIDIGAGTTDVTVVQGMLPGADRQRSVAVAGDEVDRRLWERLSHLYPDLDMPMVRVTRLKEQYAYVAEQTRSVAFRYPVLGKPQSIEAGEALRSACEVLLSATLPIVTELLEKSPGELMEGLQQNIILAGGGSRIEGLDLMFQNRLRAAGFDQAAVHKVKDYQYLVAQGAAAMAAQSRPSDWQNLPVPDKAEKTEKSGKAEQA